MLNQKLLCNWQQRNRDTDSVCCSFLVLFYVLSVYDLESVLSCAVCCMSRLLCKDHYRQQLESTL